MLADLSNLGSMVNSNKLLSVAGVVLANMILTIASQSMNRSVNVNSNMNPINAMNTMNMTQSMQNMQQTQVPINPIQPAPNFQMPQPVMIQQPVVQQQRHINHMPIYEQSRRFCCNRQPQCNQQYYHQQPRLMNSPPQYPDYNPYLQDYPYGYG